MKGLGSPLIWRGILAVVVGVIAGAWPGISIGAFIILFAVDTFVAAGMEAIRAFRSETAGPVAGQLVLSFLDVATGVVALAWPGITGLALVLWVAAWALVTGVAEIALAVNVGGNAGERALLGLAGLVSVALGVVLVIRPEVGAVTLAQVYGLFSIVCGISSLVMGANLRMAVSPLRVDEPMRWS